MNYWTTTETITRWQIWLVAIYSMASFFVFGWIARGWREEDKRDGNPIMWWVRHRFTKR